ncbi:MAG: putative porin [Bacteroidota bacterium]|nr:putative porin [Bacteroidota bacterium]
MKKISLILLVWLACLEIHGQTFVSFTETGDTIPLADSILTVNDMRSLYWRDPGTQPISSLGNIGLAVMPLSFNPLRSFLPATGSGQGYALYFPDREDIRFFNVSAPVSEMRYHSAYGRGQLFHAYFTQNITPYWNGFFQYKRINSEGKYFRQKVQSDNLRFSTSYTDPSSRYNLWFSFDWTKVFPEHNGGLLYDSVFTDNTESNRRLVEMKLNQTIYRRSRVQANLLHRFRILGDSLGEEGIFIRHKASYNRIIQTLRSTDEILYDIPNYSSTTQDSLFRSYLNNEAWLDFAVGKKLRFDISAGIGNRVGTYEGPYWYSADNTTYLLGEASVSLSRWELFGSLQQALFGTFDRSLKYSFGGRFTGKEIQVNLRYDIFQREQDLFDILYLSNSRIWLNTDFNPSVGNIIHADLFFRGFRAGAEISAISDLVFYDQEARPFQVGETVDYSKFWGSYHWEVLPHLKWRNQLTIQASTKKDTLYRMPDWVYETWLYTDWDLFRGNLQAQLGLEYKFFPEFRSYSFDPTTANFYLANNENQVIGGYHYLTLFGGVQIGDAKVFLRMENILMGLIPYDYFGAPGYPLPDRVLRVGVKWRFLN